MVSNERAPSIVGWLLDGPGRDDEAYDRLRARIDEGWSLPGSDDEARGCLEDLALGGDADACLLLGLMLENGIGIPESLQDALGWYQRAADAGDALSAERAGEACFRLGLSQGAEGERAFWETGSRYGNVDCVRGLGWLCESEGTEKSLAEAVRLYMRGVTLGDSKSVRCIGNLYERGLGLPQSYEKAAEWYGRSADMGYSEAQCDLGYLYDNGLGVEQDCGKAAKLYRMSADQGCARALNNLGFLYARGEGVDKDDARAFECFSEAARMGDVDAANNLGYAYQHALGVERDYSEALLWYSRAAGLGEMHAQCNLASMYRNGLGVEQDSRKAFELYSESAAQGHVVAEYYLGEMYESGDGVEQDYGKAMEWYMRAAEHGDEDAQNSVGSLYLNGHGVPKSYEEAARWYRKAAENGSSDAAYNLGRLYETGRGVQRSDEDAFRWYLRAAEQGDADAQINVGIMFENGRGTERSEKKAVGWYRKAAEQGLPTAQYNMGVVCENGIGVPVSYEEAFGWFLKAAEQGDADAQCSLGFLYETGNGVEQSYEKAAEWYRKGAESGDPEAMFHLGLLHLDGLGVPASDEEAFRLFLESAEDGYDRAQNNVGYMYEHGQGVGQDIGKAFEWYSKAADQGHMLAQHSLGHLYEEGKGVEKSPEKALGWYRRSLESGNEEAGEDVERLRSELSGRASSRDRYRHDPVNIYHSTIANTGRNRRPDDMWRRPCRRTICRGFTMRRENMAILIACAVAVLAILACLFITQGDKQDKGDDQSEKLELVPVTVGAYNMSTIPYDLNDPRYYEDSKPASHYKTGDFRFMTVKGEPEVLYATFETFADLFRNDYADGYSGVVTSSGSAVTWTINDKDGKEVYHVTADTGRQEFRGHGDPYSALKHPEGKNTLMEGVSLEIVEVQNAGKEYAYSFKGYGLGPFMHEGKAYLPIGLMSMHVQHDIERSFVYSSKEGMLFEYAKSEQLESAFGYGTYGESATISKIVCDSMSQYEQRQDGDDAVTEIVPPVYMREHTKRLFIWTIDNYYGLRGVLGYKDMSDYVDNTAYESLLLSANGSERTKAYCTILSLLNDGHTSYSVSGFLRENGSFLSSSYPQTLIQDRLSFSRLMSPIREKEIQKLGEKAEPTDVRYSSDGKTAYFSFDEFMISYYYNETPAESDYYHDTFHILVNNLKEIKNKGGVERVVIDDTLNGGGYVLVMGKILALMSKDNRSSIYMKNENSGVVTKYSYRVDTNGDGAYDTEDCFVQHFKFYIVTSHYSFSCGNALPFYAVKSGVAETVGSRTGGGECTVDSLTFPFGQAIGHSSSSHVGLYDEATGEFTGVEAGVNPHVLSNFNVYDVDEVSKALIKYENRYKS